MSEEGEVHVKRVRRSAPKSRGGCITCKIRRIKCDEIKPKCSQCITTGRKCDGYLPERPKKGRTGIDTPDVSPSWSDSETPSAETVVILPPAVARMIAPCAQINHGLVGNPRERRCFYYFQQRATDQLAGDHDSEFWKRLVLQAAHQSPPIRHAIVAVGALCEQHETTEPTSLSRGITPDAFALHHYIKAIKALIEPISKQGHQAVDVALVTCVLFVAFELLRGHSGAALSHINSGSKILLEQQLGRATRSRSDIMNVTPTTPYVPLKHITALMERLDIQAAMVTTRPLILDKNPNGGGSYVSPDQTAPFKSLEEARKSFDIIYDAIIGAYMSFNFVIKGITDGEEEFEPLNGIAYSRFRSEATENLSKWSQAFKILLQKLGENLDEEDREKVWLLRMQQSTASMCLDRNLTDLVSVKDATRWDAYASDFEEIIGFAKPLIHSMARRKRVGKRFTLNSGIVPPLFTVAVGSRDPVLRREAISLLRLSNSQEGLFNCAMLVQALEKFVEIEERGIDVNGYVPASARITDLRMKFEEDGGRAFLRYIQRKDVDDPGLYLHQEWI